MLRNRLVHLPGDEIEQVYFLHKGIVSLMAISAQGEAIATASVGSEGAIGTIAGTGFVRAFTRAMVQAPGVASQIAVSHFRRAVSKSEAISDLLTRYHMALMCQVQQTSLCNSVHDATSRLSRLLLVLSEQGGDDTISFCQERLADMLGLRRSSVTVAAQTLQSRRLISYRRGRIEIVNRKGLKAAACECYEVVSRTFDQFLEDIHGERLLGPSFHGRCIRLRRRGPRGLGFAGAWVKHSPPKRLRNASAVAVSGKQNRI